MLVLPQIILSSMNAYGSAVHGSQTVAEVVEPLQVVLNELVTWIHPTDVASKWATTI